MPSIQHLISEYLQCELYHSLGAYTVAEKHLVTLAEKMQGERAFAPPVDDDPTGPAPESTALCELVEISRRYNHKLGWHRYASEPRMRFDPIRSQAAGNSPWPARDPLPDELPLTNVKRFRVGDHGLSVDNNRAAPWSSERDWDRVPRFYTEAIAALEEFRDSPESDYDEYRTSTNAKSNRHNFARSLIAPREGAVEEGRDRAAEERLNRRLARYVHRRSQAHLWLAPEGDRKASVDPHVLRREYPQRHAFLQQIMTDDLTSGDDSLPVFVMRVHAEAHLSMHAVEAWRSMCLGEHARTIGPEQKRWLNRELDRSIALFTFAFCVSRTAPWVFAKNETERTTILESVAAAWENVVPARCMWIASQTSLLALHRRGYARFLKGDTEGAYNDYHKLQQLIRDAERRVLAAPLHIEGAREFLAGLNAETHHHIGELYRAQHAHKPALEHFEAASHRLELLRRDDSVKEILANSRWYVKLQISQGKACYEMGRHKEALSWHLHAWRAFLDLLASETETVTNTDTIEEAIEWLESVKFEPELRKSEVLKHLRPVVDQLDRINMVGRAGALAAEILLRLGHLLFVLNIGSVDLSRVDQPVDDDARDRAARERIRRTLAFACLRKASECDPHSTLVGADLLKARFRINTWMKGPLKKEYARHLKLPELEPIGKQWPRGGNEYEQLARVAEYLMLKARVPRFEEPTPDSADEAEVDALLARDLLLSLFMNTDSINVRKSQIHRFLMKPASKALLPERSHTPAVEFICMRRYSSPFPLLPRPSAFRALGGGYMVRLHAKTAETDRQRKPFGIVVDPGVDFVENLYRAGYSLGDINMVVLTHDHVDHIGALDPLLSLLHVRSQLLSKQAPDTSENEAHEPIAVLTSRSVQQRYRNVGALVPPEEDEELEEDAEDSKRRKFTLQCFEDLMDKAGVLTLPEPIAASWPQDFEIVAMSSTACNPDDEYPGHRDLSELPSHGVCFRVVDGQGPSVAITSDTPPPPPATEAAHQLWRKVWGPALAADLLVVHLGSVPLTELRQMDPIEGAEDPTLAEDEKELTDLRTLLERADEEDENLRGQVEYAQWLRSHAPDKKVEIKPAPLVGEVDAAWRPPPEHNFLSGVLRWARAYTEVRSGFDKPSATKRSRRAGLFVIGELSEELGTMRGKVASRLNERMFGVDARRRALNNMPFEEAVEFSFPYALTADIGLHACVTSDAGGRPGAGSRVEVLCTTCNLDTDRAPEERYHVAHDVYEVCVKGENEGIFYNCIEHDPSRQDDPAFLEKLERFDIFGR